MEGSVPSFISFALEDLLLQTPKKIAIIHDWLTVYGGAERVLEHMLLLFPHADLFSLVDFLPQGQRGFIQNKPVKTSFIQNLPFAKDKYRQYLLLMPLAVEQFDLSGYDLVISNSYAVAKGVLTGPDQLHLCICCSPIRYAWDLQHQYLRESGLDQGVKGWIAKWFLHRMRLWDARTANGVDEFIAISKFIARRIWKVYHRRSTVIYPPVDVKSFTLCKTKEDFYLTASRMVPYKHIDLIVKAFSQMPDKKLVVIGDGPDFEKIHTHSAANIVLMGYQTFDVLKNYMQRAKAFVFAAEEDFGITPVEAQSCGTPVIAFGKGGALETIRGLSREQPTGVFFENQDVDSLKDAVMRFEKSCDFISPSACRANALRFNAERFQDEMKVYIEKAWTDFQKRLV